MKEWNGRLTFGIAIVPAMVTYDIPEPFLGRFGSWRGFGFPESMERIEEKEYETEIGKCKVSRVNYNRNAMYFEFVGSGPIQV